MIGQCGVVFVVVPAGAEREIRVFVLLGGRTANFAASPIVALTSRSVSDLRSFDSTFSRFHNTWLTMWLLHFEC
jgi:hypothetical protein